MKAIVKAKAIRVRRDANTQADRTVAIYELPILRVSFGAENVVELSDDTKVVQLEAEAERMSMRYGAGKVIKVYGDDGGERLREKIEAAIIERLEDEQPEGDGEQPGAAQPPVATKAAPTKTTAPKKPAAKTAPTKTTTAKTATSSKADGAPPMTADQILAGANA